MYSHGRVGSFPEWVRSLPDKEALYSLLKDEEKIKTVLPEKYHGIFFSQDIKYWYKNSVLVPLFFPENNKAEKTNVWFLYNKISDSIKMY